MTQGRLVKMGLLYEVRKDRYLDHAVVIFSLQGQGASTVQLLSKVSRGRWIH